MTELHLDRNELRIIKENTFKDLKNLKKLSLFSNIFEEISKFSFAGTNANLQSLNLSANCISLIKENAFYDLKSLWFLSLERNILTGISRNSFAGLINLNILNRITKLNK